jgi:transposase
MLDTMDTEKKRVRRNHSAELKAQVVAECELPGASVAKVAMGERPAAPH